MIIKNLNEIELKNSRGSKQELIKNIDKIINDFKNKKSIELLTDKKEDNKKLIEFYKHETSRIEIYEYTSKNYLYYILSINDNTSVINFLIREDELNNYFRNYFKNETIETIKKLDNKKIIEKLNRFDFLIYNDFIILLHLNNDFTKKETTKK